MPDQIKINVAPDELRHIAVLRAIKEVDKPDLVGPADTGVALARLISVVPNLSELEEKHSGPELKLFLRGFISGIASLQVQEVPYDLDPLGEPEYTGGRSGGVRVGQGDDPRLIPQTGPQDS